MLIGNLLEFPAKLAYTCLFLCFCIIAIPKFKLKQSFKATTAQQFIANTFHSTRVNKRWVDGIVTLELNNFNKYHNGYISFIFTINRDLYVHIATYFYVQNFLQNNVNFKISAYHA